MTAAVLAVLANLATAAGPPETSEFSASGFNVLRIEQEDKLTVPPELAEEVWNFLHHWLVEDTESLKQLDPLFTSYWHDELFTDTYFDTPALDVLAAQGGVRHRRRVNLTDPDHRKSGRELMQIKINDLSQNALERGEFKFEIAYPEKVRSHDDMHPMLGLVEVSQRASFKTRLQNLGLDPGSMRPILTIHDRRRRIYILRDQQPFMSISHDSATANLLWSQWQLFEIEPELNEIPYTEGDAATRDRMTEIGARISAAITERFPQIQRDLRPKYNKAFDHFQSQIPGLRLLVRMNLLHGAKLGAIAGGLILIVLGALFGRRIFGAGPFARPGHKAGQGKPVAASSGSSVGA